MRRIEPTCPFLVSLIGVLVGCSTAKLPSAAPPSAESVGLSAALAVRLSPELVEVADLKEPAAFTVTIENRGSRAVVLPVGRILLGENLLVRVFSEPANDPFLGNGGAAEVMRILTTTRVTSDVTVVLRPGERHAVAVSAMGWQEFRDDEPSPPAPDRWRTPSDWHARACFTGEFGSAAPWSGAPEPTTPAVLSNVITIRVTGWSPDHGQRTGASAAARGPGPQRRRRDRGRV